MDDKELVEVWRKEFEKIYSNGVNVDRHNEGDYVRDSTEYLWQGFLMAKRSQPVIELTKKPKLTGIDSDYSKGILEGFNICRVVDVLSITAAGIKYTTGE